MATTEQFSLRWNNFHSNLTSGFHELLEAAEMVDVTLAVDGHFLQAHKIVLSICSPYFKQMFKVNPCKHPIVILKDVSHENMKDILEFMYMGEVSVLRENLTQFLRTAELLQVKGLTGDDSSEDASSVKDAKTDCDIEDNEIYNHIMETDLELPISSQSSAQMTSNYSTSKRSSKSANGSTNQKRPKTETHLHQSNPMPVVKQDYEPVKTKSEHNSCDIISNTDNIVNVTKPLSETEETKDLMNTKAIWENSLSSATSVDLSSSEQGKADKQTNKNPYQCGQCMKKFSRRDHLRTHEKNIHGEFAGPFKCVICEQLYKNTESLRKHIAKFHFSTINETIQRIEVNV